MFKLGKKGMTESFLVSVIITLVAAALIGGTIMRFMSTADEKSAESLCRDSIALRARTAFNFNPDVVGIEFIKAQIKAIPVLCKTIDKKVSGSREEIKRIFAEKIARCWWMFGEGRYEELLHGSDLELLPQLFHFDELENKCFNCYNLMIDQDEIKGTGEMGGIPAHELVRYLNENKISFINSTYLNYVQTGGGPGRVTFMMSGIVPREAYGISMMPKNKEASDFWDGVTKVAIGVGIGVVVIGVTALGVACVGTTLGACAVVLSSAAVVMGESAALTTGVVAAGAVKVIGTATAIKAAIVIGGASSYMAASGMNNIMSESFSEREISTISISYLNISQQKCGSGDLAGE